MSARYVHRCPDCAYIGACDYPWGDTWIATDLYYCSKSENALGGTVLARRSDEPGDYASAPMKIAAKYLTPFSTMGLAIHMAYLIQSQRETKST